MLAVLVSLFGDVKHNTGETMKIVIWKSPKYISKLLAKLFGVEGKEKKE